MSPYETSLDDAHSAPWWAIILRDPSSPRGRALELIGHLESRRAAESVAGAITRALNLEVDIRPSPMHEDDPLPCQILITRRGDEVSVDPIRLGAPPPLLEGTGPLIRPKPGEVVVEVLRFEASWGRWDARKYAPSPVRAQEQAPLTAEATDENSDSAEVAEELESFLPPPGAEVRVADQPMVEITMRPTGYSAEHTEVLPEPLATSREETLRANGFHITRRESVKPGETIWVRAGNEIIDRPTPGAKLRVNRKPPHPTAEQP